MNRAKQRGTSWETACVDYLRANGFPSVERRALAGALDKGDLAGLPGFAVECKDVAALNLAGWCDEARAEAKNAGAPWWCVIAKRRRAKGSTGSAADAYVVMSLAVFADLLKEQ